MRTANDFGGHPKMRKLPSPDGVVAASEWQSFLATDPEEAVGPSDAPRRDCHDGHLRHVAIGGQTINAMRVSGR